MPRSIKKTRSATSPLGQIVGVKQDSNLDVRHGAVGLAENRFDRTLKTRHFGTHRRTLILSLHRNFRRQPVNEVGTWQLSVRTNMAAQA